MFIYVFLKECMAREKRITGRLIIYRSKSIHSCFIGDTTDMLYTIGIILQVYCRSIRHTSGLCSFSHKKKARLQYLLFIMFIILATTKSPFIQFVFATQNCLLPQAWKQVFIVTRYEESSSMFHSLTPLPAFTVYVSGIPVTGNEV